MDRRLIVIWKAALSIAIVVAIYPFGPFMAGFCLAALLFGIIEDERQAR